MTNNNILLVDDDPATIRVMGRILAGIGALRFADSGAEALQLAHVSAPDLILLDAEMPGMSGFDVCRTLKADPMLADIPVIFVTGHSQTELEVTGFELGAADFIAKPVSPPLMLARVKTQLRLKRMADEMRRLATIDGLSNLSNRRHFDETLAREWKRAQRAAQPIALLMVDIDHFKLFNDYYGHPAGDACLKSVAQALVTANLRATDLVARYGGEEFVILLTDTAHAGAELIAQRVLDAVKALRLPHLASPTSPLVTVSVGIGCFDGASNAWVEPSATPRCSADQAAPLSSSLLIAAADKALYAAKHGGRAQAEMRDVANADAPATWNTASSSRPRRSALRAGATSCSAQASW